MRFGFKQALERHVKAIHEQLKPHKCAVCNKTFGAKDTLKVHVKTVHEKLKPHQCEFCKKMFWTETKPNNSHQETSN